MTVQELLSRIDVENLYRKLTQATEQYYRHLWEETKAKQDLQSVYTKKLAEGVITGKNDAEREGNARKIISDLYNKVDETGAASINARCYYELAKIEERSLENLIRLVDLKNG